MKIGIPDTSDYVEIVSKKQAIKFISNKKTLAFDIETSKTVEQPNKTEQPKAGIFAKFSKIELLQFSNGKKTIVTKYHPDIVEAMESVSNLITHNSKFEFSHIYYNTKKKFLFEDTQLMARLIDDAIRSPKDNLIINKQYKEGKLIHKPGVSLASCCERYLGVVLSKQEQSSDWAQELTESQLLYAGMDAYYTYHLAKKLMGFVKKLKCTKLYKLYIRMHVVTGMMQLVGFGYNVKGHRWFQSDWEKEKNKLNKKLVKVFGDINVNSSAQLGEWLTKTYPKLVDNFPKTAKGALSFSSETLGMYDDLKGIKELSEYKKLNKLITTYGKRLEQKAVNNRIHGNLWVGSTRTGRMSSSNPNLQNMPARGRGSELRKIFLANKGNVLVGADYAQIEIRVAGLVSKDKYILQCYREGLDLHSGIVAKLMNKPIHTVTKLERFMGKAVNFGLLFGMGAKKLKGYAKNSYGVDMTEQEAYKFYETFHNLYSGYSSWCEVQRNKSNKTLSVKTPLGRIRKLNQTEVYTCSVNTVVQGGASEIVMLACYYCYKALPKGALLVNVVHDEIIIECKEHLAEEVKDILTSCMIKAYLKVFPDAPTLNLVEANIGENWSEIK